MLPTAVALRKVVMSDKWQQINLRLDAELAQVLREMKQGHDESLSEVVLRLLKKAVRQGAPAPRGPTTGRTSPRGGARGAAGTGRGGKPLTAAGRKGPGVGSRGKPWAAPATGDGAGNWVEGRRPKSGWVVPPAREPRRSAGKLGKPGKAARPQPRQSTGEPRRRNFRPGTEGPRSTRPPEELGAGQSRPKRPRKARPGA